MSFKDSYKKDIDKIAPSEDFNSRLAKRMESEKNSESRRQIKLVTAIAASAACMALVIGVSVAVANSGGLTLNSASGGLTLDSASGDKANGNFAGVMDGEADGTQEMTFNEEAAQAPAEGEDYDVNEGVQGDDFSCEIDGAETSSPLNWYEDGLTDEQVLAVLVERLKTDTESLYVSQTETFDSDGLLSQKEIQSLAVMIENGEATDVCGEATDNYMAVFSDGAVAGFTICTDNTLCISGIETAFKF